MSDVKTLSITAQDVLEVFEPECDPVESDGIGPLYVHELHLDEDGDLSIETYRRSGDGTPEPVWNGRTTSWELGEWYDTPTAEEAEHIAQLLSRVYDGHEVIWDGRNWVGKLDEDATIAKEELEQLLGPPDGLLNRDEVILWDPDDWFQGGELDEMAARIAAGETTIAKEIRDAVTEDPEAGRVDLIELRRRLEEMVADLKEEEE